MVGFNFCVSGSILMILSGLLLIGCEHTIRGTESLGCTSLDFCRKLLRECRQSPSATLEDKWRLWYRTLDINKDGVASPEDYEGNIRVYDDIYKYTLDAGAVETLHEKAIFWWNDIVFGSMAGKNNVTEDEMIEAMSQMYKSNLPAFENLAGHMFLYMTEMVDVDHDGFISLDEFIVSHKAIGQSDEVMLRELFLDLEPNDDNKITNYLFLASWEDVFFFE